MYVEGSNVQYERGRFDLSSQIVVVVIVEEQRPALDAVIWSAKYTEITKAQRLCQWD